MARSSNDPKCRVLLVTVTVVAAVVGLTGLWYIFSATPPYGFYYDLGANIQATSLIAHWIHGFADLLDSFGWAGWANVTQFGFNPEASYVGSVPLAMLFGGNGVTGVKAMQVLEVAGGGAGMAYLFKQIYGRSGWSAIAGLLYSLLPQVLLMIRGNIDYGLAVALTPICIAWPLSLARRNGAAALPLAGAIAGLCSLCIATEFIFFQGIPAYLIAASIVFRRTRRWVWALFSLIGLAAVGLSGAYVAFASLGMGAYFTSSEPNMVLLGNGQSAVFGEGFTPLVAAVMSEFVYNPRPEFNVKPLLWLMVPLGLMLWTLAVGYIIGAVRSRRLSSSERAIAITATVCAVLALGPQIPGIGMVWVLISRFPGLNNLRTPDRFITLVVVALVLFATQSLRLLSISASPLIRRSALVAVPLLAAFGIAMFFSMRVMTGDPSGWGDREPDLAQVSQIAVEAGGRTATYAEVRGGSVFDSPSYGLPAPLNLFQGDFTQRYEGDGFGGSSILERLNTETFVSTPNWAVDSSTSGSAALTRASNLYIVFGTPYGVMMQEARRARGYVVATSIACMHGGPGLLEYALALPSLSGTALKHDARGRCDRDVYLDAAPTNALLRGLPVSEVPGVVLFPESGLMRDIDYRVANGRYFLNIPWYRNSVDGDAPEIGAAAVSVNQGMVGTSVMHVEGTGSYALALHLACHSTVAGQIEIDTATRAFSCKQRLGFQWVEIPIGALPGGDHRVTVRIDHIGKAALLGSSWSLAVDGIMLVKNARIAPPTHSALWIFSAQRFVTYPETPPEGTLSLVHQYGFATSPGKVLVAIGSDASAVYRWDGPAADYIVQAKANLNSVDSYVGIGRGSNCCETVMPYDALASQDKTIAPTTVSASLRLRPRALLTVFVHTSSRDSSAVSTLVSLTSAGEEPVLSNDGRTIVYAADFTMGFLPGGVSAGGASPYDHFGFGLGAPPLFFETPAFPDQSIDLPTSVSVVLAGDSAASTTVTCGAYTVHKIIASPGGSMMVPPSHNRRCRVGIASFGLGAGAIVQHIDVGRPLPLPELRGTRWIAAGTYRVRLLRLGGADATGVLFVDGSHVRGTVHLRASGKALLRWDNAPADAAAVAFVPSNWPSSRVAINVRQIASQRWDVRVDRVTSIEAAVFPDGNWHLLSRNGAPVYGTRCDLANTCFLDVPAGRYRLLHNWPSYMVLGMATSVATLLCSIALLALFTRRSRQDQGPLGSNRLVP